MKKRYYEMKSDKQYAVYKITVDANEIKRLRDFELSLIPKDERFYVAKSRMLLGGRKILEGFFTGENISAYISAKNVGLKGVVSGSISRLPESFEIDQRSSLISVFDDQLGDTAYLDWRDDLSFKYISGAFDGSSSIPFMVRDLSTTKGETKYFLATRNYCHKVDWPEGSYMMDGIIQISKKLFLLELFLRDAIPTFNDYADDEEFNKIMQYFTFKKQGTASDTKEVSQYAINDSRIHSRIVPFLRQSFKIGMVDSTTLEKTVGYILNIPKSNLQDFVAKGIKNDGATVQLGEEKTSNGETFIKCTPVIDLDPYTFYSERKNILTVPSVGRNDNGEKLPIISNISNGNLSDGKIRALSVSDRIYNLFLLVSGNISELVMRVSDEELKKLCDLGTINGFTIDGKGKSDKQKEAIFKKYTKRKEASIELLKRLKDANIIKKEEEEIDNNAS